jgi:hypothetical protein
VKRSGPGWSAAARRHSPAPLVSLLAAGGWLGLLDGRGHLRAGDAQGLARIGPPEPPKVERLRTGPGRRRSGTPELSRGTVLRPDWGAGPKRPALGGSAVYPLGGCLEVP